MSYFNTTVAQHQPIISDAVRAVERQQYVGQYILPFIDKGSITGRYPTIGAQNFDNDVSAPRARGASAKRVDYEFSSDTFECLDYSLESACTDSEIDEADDDGLDDLVISKANLTADALLLGHDIRVSNALSSAGFASDGATAQMSNASSAKPITDITNAVQRLKDKGFYNGLNLIIESSLWTEMKNTDDFRDLINGSGRLMLNTQDIASLLGLSGIVIAGSGKNTSAKGKTASRNSVWSTNSFYVAQLSGGNFSNGGIGRTVADSRYAPTPYGVYTYRNEELEENIIKVKNRVGEIITNAQAGELITGA